MLWLPLDDDTELRLLEVRHAGELFALVDRNRRYLRQWLPWVDATATVDDERAFILASLEGFAQSVDRQFGIWRKGEIRGAIGLSPVDTANLIGDIGYWVSEDCQGAGLATRACAAVINHALGEMGLNRVVIRAAVDNDRSRAIPERLGFTLEGVARQSFRVNDRYQDLAQYSLLASEWVQVPPS